MMLMVLAMAMVSLTEVWLVQLPTHDDDEDNDVGDVAAIVVDDVDNDVDAIGNGNGVID